MFRVGFWLNLAAIACLAWGIFSSYQTYERELGRAHAVMGAKFNVCASGVYETHAFEEHRLQLLTTQCGESLDDDRWLPVLAPNLSRDTLIAGAGPAVLALALAFLPFLTGRRRGRPARAPGSAEIVR